MFPAIKQIFSPSSSNGSKDDDHSSLTDTYFKEIGFKCAENSLLGSTESPELDGEALMMDDRSLGLDADVEAPEQRDPVAKAQAKNETTTAAQRGKFLKKKAAPSKLKAYSRPFHSYFQNLLTEDGKSVEDDLKYSPSSSAYAISVRKPAAGGDQDWDVSTLGDGSLLSGNRKSPQWEQILVGASLPEIKNARTRSTSFGQNSNSTDTDDQDSPGAKKKSKSSKNSKDKHSAEEDDDDESALATRWTTIYFMIGLALFLLTAACVVLSISLIQLKQKVNDDEGASEIATATTDAPKDFSFGSWTYPPTPAPQNDTTPEAPQNDTTPEENSMTAREEDLLSILSILSPNSLAALSDESSPQFQAFEWLSDDPDYLFYSSGRIVQRWTMATFYFSTSVGESSWKTRRMLDADNSSSTSWLSHSDECFWYSTDPLDVCDEEGRIKAIHVEDSGLVGTLPRELGLLSNSLERIYLRSNNLSGVIPTEVGLLTKLDRLQLTLNSINGTIPSEVGLMQNLVILGLGRNQIQGSIPPHLGQLTSLRTLGLEGNQIGGTIPVELANMTSLEYVALESNNLHGTVPADFRSLPFLSSLSLQENDLTGVVPICPASEFLQTLTADCDEITCDCCTECCTGCDGANNNNGTLVLATSPPSASPTGLFDQLRPNLSPATSSPPSLPPVVDPWAAILDIGLPSSIPSDMPSLIPSDSPSLLPSLAPTICVPSISVDKPCYFQNSDEMTISFHNCDAAPFDWVGLYNEKDLSDLRDGDEIWRSDADSWVRACGDETCSESVMTGNITVGAVAWKFKKGTFTVVLLRGNVVQTSQEGIEVDNNC